MTNKIYRTFKVGGDPTKIAFLAENLSNTVDEIQSLGWTIERIDSINNTRAWDCNKQIYVSTTEYIIIAYCNACETKTGDEWVDDVVKSMNKNIIGWRNR